MTHTEDPLGDALARISKRAKSYNPSDRLGLAVRKPPEDAIPTKDSKQPAGGLDRDNTGLSTTFAGASQGGEPVSSDADVGILCALQDPELQQAMDAFGAEWRREIRQGEVFWHGTIPLGGRDLTLVLACQTDMGLVPAAILTTKTVLEWRPTLIAMVGICAGVRGKVHLGDVVVGRQVFDYGSGKIVNGRIHPDFQPISMDNQLLGYTIELANDEDALGKIRDAWPTKAGRPETLLKAHVGSLGSGAAVVAEGGVVDEIIEHQRSLLAVDMEAYGVARAVASSIWHARSLVVKGVQDFADTEKNDDFREYSAFVSARFLRALLERYWIELRASPLSLAKHSDIHNG